MFLQTTASGESKFRARRPLRVLIADDEQDTVTTLVVLLCSEGYEVVGVHDGAGVLRETRKFQPDAVILDIGMPGLTGYDVARALRAEHGGRCPALIAVTAYASMPEKLAGKAAGFDHYFAKPVVVDELLTALSTATSRR